MKRLNKAVVRELLKYEPTTGKLFWKRRARKWFSTEHDQHVWNTRYAGKEAFISIGGNGYLHGSIFHKMYIAHRIIWLWMTGKWPDPEVDHNNHRRTDNRWSNLSETSINQRNVSHKNSISGHTGIQQVGRKWTARIGVNKQTIYLGIYPSIEDAIAARKIAERKYGFHPNHGMKL